MIAQWGERRGSNPRHPGPQPGALPAELRPPCLLTWLMIRQKIPKVFSPYLRVIREERLRCGSNQALRLNL